MGCHTWFHRKIERTQEEAKENCLQGLRKSLESWTEATYNVIYDENDVFVMPHPSNTIRFNYPEWTQEYCEHVLAVIKRQIRMVENNLCQRAVWNHQDDKRMTEYIDGKGLYIEDTGYHDVFRKHGYPNIKLFSLEETLEYINNPENKCIIYDWTMDDLKEFWSKYTDAFIDFG